MGRQRGITPIQPLIVIAISLFWLPLRCLPILIT